MSQLKTGACGHVIAVWDLRTARAGCRPCETPDKPCEVCDGMSPALKERVIRARARRLKRPASKRRARSSDSVFESSLRSTPGPREPSLPPTGVMSPPYPCGQEGGACVSPHSNETWDGDRVLPTGKRGKKRPSSQLLLPRESTPAKVRVSPQPSGSRDVDRAAACVSPQTSVSRDDDATCVSPRPSQGRCAREGNFTVRIDASRRQGFRRQPRSFDLATVERSLGEKAGSPPSVEEPHGVYSPGAVILFGE